MNICQCAPTPQTEPGKLPTPWAPTVLRVFLPHGTFHMPTDPLFCSANKVLCLSPMPTVAQADHSWHPINGKCWGPCAPQPSFIKGYRFDPCTFKCPNYHTNQLANG